MSRYRPLAHISFARARAASLCLLIPCMHRHAAWQAVRADELPACCAWPEHAHARVTVSSGASIAQVVAAAQGHRQRIVRETKSLAGRLEREGSPLGHALASELRQGAEVLGAANVTCALAHTCARSRARTLDFGAPAQSLSARQTLRRCISLASPATRILVGGLVAEVLRAEIYRPPDGASGVSHDSCFYAASSSFNLMPLGTLYFQARSVVVVEYIGS